MDKIEPAAFVAKVEKAYREWFAVVEADNPKADPDARENIMLKHAFLAGWHAALVDVRDDP